MRPTIEQLWWLPLAVAGLAVLGRCVREWIRCREARKLLELVLRDCRGSQRAEILHVLIEIFRAPALPPDPGALLRRPRRRASRSR